MTQEFAEIVTVTPELAGQWLKSNTRNRKLNEGHVDKLIGAMLRGEFQFNGDAIRFSKSNEILDGQHRLHAVQDSGVTIRQVVVRGLESESQVTMDRQNKRTLGHHLDIMAEANTKVLTSALNMSWQWDRGIRWKIGTGGAGWPTYEQSYDYLLDNPGIRTSADIGPGLRSRKIMRESTAAMLHWIFSRLDSALADEFFERMISGVHVDDGDPVWALRERSKNLRSERMEIPQTVVPLACKAWNYFRDGRTFRSAASLRIRIGGDSPEAFPEPK